MNLKKICFIEVWLGKIPSYFKFHAKTLTKIKNIDFYFYTDDTEYDFSKIETENLIIGYINKDEFISRFNRVSRIQINQIEPIKKIVDFKLAYFNMFSDVTKDYDYVGIYDIDTLFGNIEEDLIDAINNDFDFISIGDKEFCNRLSGPLLILKNTEELVNLYRSDRYYETLQSDEIYGYGEKELSKIAMADYKTKILDGQNLDAEAGGKISYQCAWHAGKVYSMGKEIKLFHFYHKERTKFIEVGEDLIFAEYDKVLVNDFIWVTGFDKNYTKVGEGLLRSIAKRSNRPCLVYSIDFDWTVPADLFASGQFIVKRINLLSEHDSNRDAIVNSKPRLMIDAVESFQNSKFVFIDADSVLTANADSIREYFKELENYPLINSHTHDDIIIHSNGQTFNSLDILLAKLEKTRKVFPRRKTNIIVFDQRSKWFFEEQISVYNRLRDSEPWIFALHEEDSANALLSKYEFHKGLPVLDIEEARNIDLAKYNDYSFGKNTNSASSKLPAHPNQVIAFHQLKTAEDFRQVDEQYGSTVIAQDEVVIGYRENRLTWQRNVYSPKNGIPLKVDFVVCDQAGAEIFRLGGQNFRDYWFFTIYDFSLSPGIYSTRIEDSSNSRVVHSDLVLVK